MSRLMWFLSFQLCVEYLEENLSVQNACDCMQAAVTYSQDDLKDKTLIFIEQHTEVSANSMLEIA